MLLTTKEDDAIAITIATDALKDVSAMAPVAFGLDTQTQRAFEALETARAGSVAKAVAVIEAFVTGPPSLGVTEAAQRAGIAKSTAFRLLAILAEHQLVERRDDRYILGKKLFEFGQKVAFCRPRGLRNVALPHMVELYQLTSSTVQLAILDGREVLYIEKLYGYNPVRSPSCVGARLPASVTALGKAILAFSDRDTQERVADHHLERYTAYSLVLRDQFMDEMQRIRVAGYAVDREESSLGLVCIAAPILIGDRAVAAISVGTQTSKGDPLVYKDAIRRVAAAIADEVRGAV